MNTKSNVFLETEPLGKLMGKYAVPCVISLLVAALYNIVDQIFIANADYLGSYGNAANTVVFPLTVVALSIAVMIGDGCCAFVSISLGVPFYMFGQAMNPIIRSDGSPQFAMASTLLGALVNIILDPVFIFVCKWGMMGAAVATVMGQILTAVLAVWYLFHMKAVGLEKNSFRFHGAVIKKYIPMGICSFLSQISLVMAMAAIQNMTLKYSALDPVFGQEQYTQIPMAVLGIVMKFFQIVISIAVGLAAGCIPVVGYNIGAGRKDRARALFTRLLTAEAIVGGVALVIVEVFPLQLIGVFGAANESIYYTQYALKCFRVYLCMTILATVNKGTFIYLQSLGRAFASTAISLVREVVFGVGFALVLPLKFGLDGVLYSMPVSDVLTFVICVAVIMYTYQTLRTECPKPEELVHT